MVSTGRGGFGNHYTSHSKELAPASSPAPVQHVLSPTYRFRTGRGGFGNTVEASQISPQSPGQYLDEVYQNTEVEPRRFMIGRGGVGNFYSRHEITPSGSESSTRSRANTGSSIDSDNSESSFGLFKVWSKVRRNH